MKKFQEYLVLTLTLFLIVSLMVGCGSKKSDYREVANERDSGFGATEEAEFDSSEGSPLEPEKVITTVYIDFETTEFEKINESLDILIKKYQAYVENSNMDYNKYYNNKSYRNGSYIIRVPRDKVLAFKSELNGIGNIISESTTKEDVTKQYRDTESRLKVIEVKEERILALLAKAEKIEDIIKLEDQLSETIYEKENLKASLISIDDKVDFSTLEINIQEVEKLTSQDTVETNFGTRLSNAFKDSLFFFKKTLEKLIIFLIYILPFAAIVGILAHFIAKLLKGKNIFKK